MTLPHRDIRYYKGKYKVELLIKGKRKGKKGRITYGVKALELIPEFLELIPELGHTDEKFCFMFTTNPRLLWRNHKKDLSCFDMGACAICTCFTCPDNKNPEGIIKK